MVRPKRTKKAKYELRIGWGLVLYCENMSEINNYIRLWGQEKCSYKELKGEN